MSEKWILEDVGVEHNDIVGKKCANLGEMRRAGVPVPHGFALSLEAYKKFMNETGTLNEIVESLRTFSADPDDLSHMERFDSKAKTLREIVESKKMPEAMEQMIAEYYESLCGKAGIEEVPVAARSAGMASHPGQYETYLYISGTSDLMKNIIRVWSSTFNARSMIARARAGAALASDPIGVAVLEMVDAQSAGVLFTLNPVNGDTSKVSIGGNWGLGEAVVSGDVSNDQWLIDKVTLEIIERGIETKTKEYGFNADSGGVGYRDIAAERRKQPCLVDEEIIELVKQAKKIEKHFGTPQDIEWVIDKRLPFPENVLFVQTRQETIWSKKEKKSILKTKDQFGGYDIFSLLENS